MERVVLNANESMMLTNRGFVTNGEIFAKRVELGDWDSPDNYREIPIEEYEKMLEADAEVIQ